MLETFVFAHLFALIHELGKKTPIPHTVAVPPPVIKAYLSIVTSVITSPLVASPCISRSAPRPFDSPSTSYDYLHTASNRFDLVISNDALRLFSRTFIDVHGSLTIS